MSPVKHRGLLDRMGGRKFLVVQQALWLTFWLALAGHLTAEWTGVAAICVGAFAAADAFVTGKAISKGVSLPSSPGGERE